MASLSPGGESAEVETHAAEGELAGGGPPCLAQEVELKFPLDGWSGAEPGEGSRVTALQRGVASMPLLGWRLERADSHLFEGKDDGPGPHHAGDEEESLRVERPPLAVAGSVRLVHSLPDRGHKVLTCTEGVATPGGAV